MFCCSGYFLAYNPVRCDEVCGDGILYELPCDDGNLIDDDGCSSTCTVEPDFVCMNASTTTPSICSYNGTFSTSLEYAEKDPNSNSLTLTYILTPSSPYYALNGRSEDVTSLISFPGKEGILNIQYARLDPVTN